jgi:predicted branched-subunit amino acid permease
MGAPLREFDSQFDAFLGGFRAAWFSVFAYVLAGTYVGIGALAFDFGFSLPWVLSSTLLMWAGPAQVVLISALGGGAALIEVAIAVGLTGVRLLPMVVALLPILRTPATRPRDLILPTHLTAVSMWVEAMRIAPTIAHERRIVFCNGIGAGYIVSALIATTVGYYLAARLPLLLTAALLFLTPVSFLISVTRNARQLVDRLALVFGLSIGPLLAYLDVGLDILWAGIGGGTIAYVIHRLRESMR